MKCDKCGVENAEGAKFCRACGNKLDGGAAHTPLDRRIWHRVTEVPTIFFSILFVYGVLALTCYSTSNYDDGEARYCDLLRLQCGSPDGYFLRWRMVTSYWGIAAASFLALRVFRHTARVFAVMLFVMLMYCILALTCFSVIGYDRLCDPFGYDRLCDPLGLTGLDQGKYFDLWGVLTIIAGTACTIFAYIAFLRRKKRK